MFLQEQKLGTPKATCTLWNHRMDKVFFVFDALVKENIELSKQWTELITTNTRQFRLILAIITGRSTRPAARHEHNIVSQERVKEGEPGKRRA